MVFVSFFNSFMDKKMENAEILIEFLFNIRANFQANVLVKKILTPQCPVPRLILK